MLGEAKAVRISAIHELAIAGDDGSGEEKIAVSRGEGGVFVVTRFYKIDKYQSKADASCAELC